MTKRKSYFNKAAETWDERFVTREVAEFLEELVPSFHLQPGDTVLDVGTGTGILLPFLLQAIGPEGSITAVDYAENMIQICRSKYAHLSHVTIELQDVEDLDLPAASFDAVICFGLFPHIDDKVKTLENLYRVLKSGGRLIIAHAFSSDEIKARHHNASSVVASDVLPEESAMRRLLQRAGFAEISINDKSGQYLCLSTKP
jgi:ubiquinone/menaquinone biosynthesis C-methylase UbiE